MLDKRLAVKILNSLYDQGDLSLSELTEVTEGNWETILRRVEELRADGLIYAHKSDKFPFRRTVGLTDEGRKTASALIPRVKNKLGPEDKLLLVLLYGLNGKLRGSTKLEKFVYRMQRETDVLNWFDFAPHKYGPFSAEVLDAAQTLASVGLVHIEEKIWSVEGDTEKKIVTYKLTPKGRKIGEDLFSFLPKDAKEKITEFKQDAKIPLEKFLKEFYKKYPEFKKQTKLDDSQLVDSLH